MINKGISELAKALSTEKISTRELVLQYYNEIEEKNKDILAYITLCKERALAFADELDARRARGENLHPLAGIPFAVKDNFCTEGVPTSCGSRMLFNYAPPYSATVVARLERCGAVMLGKTNMDEFGMGSATDTSFFGITKNPLDNTRTAGGSSGGSAAAVSGGMAAFALGSDTGGSVRLPASFCGCVGLKPTRGALSRYGLVAFASSLDTVGVLASSVDDTKIVFDAIRGRDVRDATSVDAPTADIKNGGLCIGICPDILNCVSSGVAESVMSAADALGRIGVRVVDVSLPDTDLCVAAYYVICCAEASSNLGRFDGVRYGHRANGGGGIDELFIKSRSEGFGEEVKRRIALGTLCLHGEGREQYYAAALSARKSITASLLNVLCECDALLLPTFPTVAYSLDEKRQSSLDIWRDDALCTLANLSGLPALCLPYGEDGGMPVGVQLMGRAHSEELLFKLGKMLAEVEYA